jgi:hypothetical protein
MRIVARLAAWCLAGWRAATSTNTRRVLTVCCLPGVLLLIAGLYVRDPPGPSSSGIADGLAKNDPSREFRERQIGQVLFSPVVGDHCKRSTFDNRTGAVESADDVLCIQLVPEAMNPGGSSSSRIDVLRRTFRNE